jgi:hypothetical protein
VVQQCSAEEPRIANTVEAVNIFPSGEEEEGAQAEECATQKRRMWGGTRNTSGTWKGASPVYEIPKVLATQPAINATQGTSKPYLLTHEVPTGSA